MIQIGINIAVKGAGVSGPPPAPVNTVLPVISGSTTLGSVLTTTNGTWTNSPSSFTYQWKRNATNVGTNTPTYTLVLADSGAAITCVVTAINGGGSASATSNIITAQTYSAPAIVSAPVISGTTTLGSVLTTTDGVWTGNPTPTFTYQWKRGVSNITSATSATYTLVLADSGAAITCVVTATNVLGNNNSTSNIITADNYAPVNAFISTFRTTTASETVTLPYEVAGTYSGTIDWGDGGPTSVNSYANRDHVYAVAGDYVITVTGVTTGFRFNSTGSNLKIRSIQNWGALRLGNNGSYFSGCINLTLTAVNGVLDTTGTTNFSAMFRQCYSLTTINNINSWNTSAVTTMQQMFLYAFAFNQPLSFDTSAVNNMSFMINNATSFNSSLTFNTSAVTNMSNMFQNALSFNQPLSFDTSAVTNMSFMFRDCSAFNQPLSFNTSAVTNMINMFQNATSFNQNIGSWNVANVTNFTNFMGSKTPATFSTTNLDAIYNGWVTVQSGRTITFGTAKYSSAGVAGRNYLTGTKLWTITDGGL